MAIHKDFGHMLSRLEEAEKKNGLPYMYNKRAKRRNKSVKKDQQQPAYRLEDQENRDRRKKLRIRGLPDPAQTENLTEKIRKVFNPILGKEDGNPIKN